MSAIVVAIVAGWAAGVLTVCLVWEYTIREHRRILERAWMIGLARSYVDAEGQTLDEWIEETLS